jgi:hypothetical protein
MTETIVCDRHGANESCCVCAHICTSLQDRKARGFIWSYKDAEHGYQAMCDLCNDMSDEAWERDHYELLKVICFGCYADAASLNGVGDSELKAVLA